MACTPEQLEYHRKYRSNPENAAKARAATEAWRQRNKPAIREKVNGLHLSRREEGISLLGGKCAHCGGVFPTCVYDFHHTDPTEKENISNLTRCKKERWLAELAKCILLCANCHRVHHYGEKRYG